MSQEKIQKIDQTPDKKLFKGLTKDELIELQGMINDPIFKIPLDNRPISNLDNERQIRNARWILRNPTGGTERPDRFIKLLKRHVIYLAKIK